MSASSNLAVTLRHHSDSMMFIQAIQVGGLGTPSPWSLLSPALDRMQEWVD